MGLDRGQQILALSSAVWEGDPTNQGDLIPQPTMTHCVSNQAILLLDGN